MVSSSRPDAFDMHSAGNRSRLMKAENIENVILSAAKDLVTDASAWGSERILRCAQDDSGGSGAAQKMSKSRQIRVPRPSPLAPRPSSLRQGRALSTILTAWARVA